MTLPQPTAFSALVKEFDGECPCCRRRFTDASEPGCCSVGLPRRSGEVLFEIIMRRYETRSTVMASNRPLEDWGKLVGDMPSATSILDRFLHHAEIITITGKSYRSRKQASAVPEPAPTQMPPMRRFQAPAPPPAANEKQPRLSTLRRSLWTRDASKSLRNPRSNTIIQSHIPAGRF